MVGLVIVSHSRALAEALANLVRQIASQDIPLAVTGGVGPDRQEFGTDAVEIMEAIQAVDGPDGVLVLMDLGSAVLSAEMALEFLDPEIVEEGYPLPRSYCGGRHCRRGAGQPGDGQENNLSRGLHGVVAQDRSPGRKRAALPTGHASG